MAELGTDTWVDDLADKLSKLPWAIGDGSGFSLEVTIEDSGAQFLIEFSAEGVSAKAGGGGDVSMTLSSETATAIEDGRVGAQAAFMHGEISLGGDTSLLLEHLAAASEAAASLGRPDES